MPAIRLSIAAAKGGVGKSTFAVNLAGYLSQEHKFKVLLIDTDSQSSTSQFFLSPEVVETLPTDRCAAAIYDQSMIAEPEKLIHQTRFAGLDFIPASERLEKFNLPEPHKTGELQIAMRNFLDEADRDYHFVIFDTPPLMASLQTWGCLLASHFAIAPLVMEDYSIQSIAKVDRMITAANELNSMLHFLGYVINIRDGRRSYQAHNEKKLRAVHGDRVFKTTISNLTAFTEAQGFRQPITEYAKSGDAVKITKAVSKEVLSRIEQLMTNASNERKVA